ncbi:MAG: GNAT family N-acetyltransferase [Deltaproteobacteria bacterium]|nr:GNAT family N-acetyltransferase [Deltaproteobacteria bacterium]MBW2695441.1 GNAT family N-acetyltransferase [Deltaproteobacteria bacterium]
MRVSASDALRLDNPVWHALRGRLASFAQPRSSRKAVRFDPEVAFFAAVERVEPDAWVALAELVGPGGVAVLFRDEVPPPPGGWTEVYRGPTYQLVAGDLDTAPDSGSAPLGRDDVEELLALTQLTEPGPFLPRTIELGGYVGVRREGRLVAMAGRRFSLPGWTEISAVCTHPEVRRQGLAAALTLQVAQGIRDRGDEAFLHVLESNQHALRLYQAIGFEVRRKIDVVAAQLGEAEAS